MEVIEAEKYKAYQQKSLEIISSKVEAELLSEMASTTKKSKMHVLSVKKKDLNELSIDELSDVLENSTDPIEIQVIYILFLFFIYIFVIFSYNCIFNFLFSHYSVKKQ